MKLIVLSDIHANLSALTSVLDDIQNKYVPDAYVILGDIVNYCMRPNEVITRLKQIKTPVICNLFGNHENALFGRNIDKFSTTRGLLMLNYTKSIMNSESAEYITHNLISSGMKETTIDGKMFLFVHGNIADPYWGKMTDDQIANGIYSKYDYVVSGHSHIPHYIEHFYNSDDFAYRNKKKTIFINPGSVGQPRNHNNRAQYSFLDTRQESCYFESVEYDYRYEQSLFTDEVDLFYRDRLSKGI